MVDDPAVIALCIGTVALILVFLLVVGSAGPAARARWLGGDGEFCWDALKAEHVTGDVRGLGPAVLGPLRIGMGLFIVGTNYWRVFVWEHAFALATFTVWSWTLISVYMILAGIASLVSASKPAGGEPEPAGVFGRFLWVLFQLMTVVAIFIFVLVWFVLIPVDILQGGIDRAMGNFGDWISLSSHNLNVVFMLTEMAVNRLNFVPTHALFIMVYAICYVIFSWFWYWNSGIFWYIFLDWNTLTYFTPLCYLGLAGMLYGQFILVANWLTRMKASVPQDQLPAVGPATEDKEEQLTELS